MNRIMPSWTDTFRVNYIENYILLVIKAYQSIGNGSHILIKKEEERRTELVEAMRNKKGEFNITFPIGYEVGEKTKRMDICCYLDGLKENNYICFECKRFLKTTITKSHFNKETVRKIRKKGLENTAGTLFACDNSAAGAFFRVLARRNPIFKRKRPLSGHDYLHYSIYSKKIYCSSEIVGKERKPHFSGDFQLSFCQQITGSVPSFHCSVWMLNHRVPLP